MQNARAELLLVRVLGEKFIATLQCFVRNLLMHQNGKVCVFLIIKKKVPTNWGANTWKGRRENHDTL